MICSDEVGPRTHPLHLAFQLWSWIATIYAMWLVYHPFSHCYHIEDVTVSAFGADAVTRRAHQVYAYSFALCLVIGRAALLQDMAGHEETNLSCRPCGVRCALRIFGVCCVSASDGSDHPRLPFQRRQQPAVWAHGMGTRSVPSGTRTSMGALPPSMGAIRYSIATGERLIDSCKAMLQILQFLFNFGGAYQEELLFSGSNLSMVSMHSAVISNSEPRDTRNVFKTVAVTTLLFQRASK